ncbi:unnamed protein product [Moneuplotes crassus]|uniref:histidine kinase n=1 Tax=Euplotes crassus TaxID=5936 RepID=A0AAD1XT92_EUPCR|nr:unnamed protein product [Moneuplotes crassus]
MKDKEIKKLYEQHRLETMKVNWSFILLILKMTFAILFMLFQFDSQIDSAYRKMIPLIVFLFLFILEYLIKKSSFVAKYGAIAVVFVLGGLLIKRNLEVPELRLYEGFLFHISICFLLSTCLIIDWKVSTLAVIVAYGMIYSCLTHYYKDVPNSIKVAIFSALVCFAFNAFLISRTFKLEFLSTYQAKQVSSQLNKVLQGLPEGVILIDSPKDKIKFVNKKLSQTFDPVMFQSQANQIEELQRMKHSIDQDFEAMCQKAEVGLLGMQDSQKFTSNILSKLCVKVKTTIIEEAKGSEPDDHKDSYEQFSLLEFLQDERELSLMGENAGRSTKVSISYNSNLLPSEAELEYRDFIVKTSKIDTAECKDGNHTFLQMFIDTTQITQLEEAKAQSSYQRQMLSNVSHEFRTPLNSMSLSLLLMKDDVAANSSRFHRIATSSCDILKGLVEDILDFSKLEAGVFQIEESVFTFAELFDDTQAIFEMQTAMKRVSLVFRMDDQLQGLKVKSDKQRLKQILLNLLSNATKFTDRGSISVDLKVKESVHTLVQDFWSRNFDSLQSISYEIPDERSNDCVLSNPGSYSFEFLPSKSDESIEEPTLKQRISETSQEEEIIDDLSDYHKELCLEMTVTDTGLGIPDKDLPSLFKLFGKTSSNHNRNKTGTGLGLTICKKLCEKLGGKISLKSKEGVGTKVTCEFLCFY